MISSAREFVELRSSEDLDEQRRAATEPATLEVWRELVSDHPDMRFWVAQNKTVPLEILAALTGDPDPRVRSMVAMKRKLSPELLERLASDPADAVRASVARHRRTPMGVLRDLASNDPWDEVRRIAAARLG